MGQSTHWLKNLDRRRPGLVLHWLLGEYETHEWISPNRQMASYKTSLEEKAKKKEKRTLDG